MFVKYSLSRGGDFQWARFISFDNLIHGDSGKEKQQKSVYYPFPLPHSSRNTWVGVCADSVCLTHYVSLKYIVLFMHHFLAFRLTNITRAYHLLRNIILRRRIIVSILRETSILHSCGTIRTQQL